MPIIHLVVILSRIKIEHDTVFLSEKMNFNEILIGPMNL